MSELLLAAVLFGAVCFWAGYWFREYGAKRVVQEYQRFLTEVAKQAEARTVEITIQKHGDNFFVYDSKTNEFLAQGSSHKQITEILNTRYPDKFFTANRDNIKEVGYHHESI